MTQTRLSSFIEACLNVATGFVVSVVVGHWAYPAFGWDATVVQNLGLTGIFTITGVIRGYLWRRYFNAKDN